EIRFITSRHLELVVEGTSPKQLTARIDILDEGDQRLPLVSRFSRKMVPRDLMPYSIMSEALQSALKDPPNARGYLSAAEARLSPGTETNYTVQELITGIFQPDAGRSAPSDRTVAERIRPLAARLWDAPVLGDELRRRMDRRMRALVVDDILNRLSLDVQNELANLCMPLAKLEAADSFLSSVA